MWTQLSRLSWNANTAQSNYGIRSWLLGLSKLTASPSICCDRGCQELQMLQGHLGARDNYSLTALVFAFLPSKIMITAFQLSKKSEIWHMIHTYTTSLRFRSFTFHQSCVVRSRNISLKFIELCMMTPWVSFINEVIVNVFFEIWRRYIKTGNLYAFKFPCNFELISWSFSGDINST